MGCLVSGRREVPVFSDTLHEHDTRTIRTLLVEVPEGTRQIIVDLVYGPRTVDDLALGLALVERVLGQERLGPTAEEMLARFAPLRNLLNIAVFDPRGRFHGRWDHNRPDQPSEATIAEQGSSPGMVDGPIPPGAWRLCLEVHQILTPCEYTLRVHCLDTLARPAVGPQLLHARARSSEWFRGDLHLHSEHSDGRNSVQTIAQALTEEGLDFFALTDHNTTTGLRDLPAGGPVNLPGLELTTFWGHATCLGVPEFVPWYEGDRLRSFGQIAAQVRAVGGLVCVAHPFAPPQPLCAGCRWEFPGFEWSDADLLEIWNGDWDEHAPINAAAFELWDRLLTAGQRIWGVAGSDMHDVDHLRSKRYPRTLVKTAGRSAGAVLQGLRSGRIVVSSGPTVTLMVVANGRRYEIGDTVLLTAEGEVTVAGSVEDAPPTAQVQLVADRTRIPCGARWEHRLRPEHRTWVRAEVLAGSTVLAATNPIFIEVTPMRRM